MQSSSTVCGVSFRKDLWKGQRRVLDAIKDRQSLNIQLPTGYGKTLSAFSIYSVLKKRGKVNRLLVIVPTDPQLIQLEKNGPSDLLDASVDGPRQVVDVRFFGAQAIEKHRKNLSQVYTITIQSLLHPRGADNIKKLLQTGRWMIVIDEYHHYGTDKAWSLIVKELPSVFLLAMSATPDRPEDDSAFGEPDVVVSYREAFEEGAVKKLIGHSYIYRLDMIGEDGDIFSYTTSELGKMAGSDSPDSIESFMLTRKMRWSPKYVSPLVSIPIERMLSDRLKTGYRLQVLVYAMCVSHAKMVCEQIRSMYDELKVDWVGTGEDGRSDEKNAAVLEKFCPPKDDYGNRPVAEIDVLVSVGMAGEGLDTTLASEATHLHRCTRNNTNNQKNGRTSRRNGSVVGHINFDSSSDYAEERYVGSAIMDAMSDSPPMIGPSEEEPKIQETELDEIPEEPTIHLHNLELDGIDSGDPEVQRMAKVLVGLNVYTREDIEDPYSQIHPDAMVMYRKFRRMEAEQHDEKSVVMQWQDSVKYAMRTVTGRVINLMKANGQRVEKSLAGDIKKRIYSRKKGLLGKMEESVESAKKHYQFIRVLEKELIDKGIPAWLS